MQRLQFPADVGVSVVKPVAEVGGPEEAPVQAHLTASEGDMRWCSGGELGVRGADSRARRGRERHNSHVCHWKLDISLNWTCYKICTPSFKKWAQHRYGKFQVDTIKR